MLTKLSFHSNADGTYSAENYRIEFHLDGWDCFKQGVHFGPSFTFPEHAMKFCQLESEKNADNS